MTLLQRKQLRKPPDPQHATRTCTLRIQTTVQSTPWRDRICHLTAGTNRLAMGNVSSQPTTAISHERDDDKILNWRLSKKRERKNTTSSSFPIRLSAAAILMFVSSRDQCLVMAHHASLNCTIYFLHIILHLELLGTDQMKPWQPCYHDDQGLKGKTAQIKVEGMVLYHETRDSEGLGAKRGDTVCHYDIMLPFTLTKTLIQYFLNISYYLLSYYKHLDVKCHNIIFLLLYYMHTVFLYGMVWRLWSNYLCCEPLQNVLSYL